MYKADNGVWFTKSLFYDVKGFGDNERCDPVFTLYQDRPGLINCRKTFIELRDPTGYKWAIKYLEDWEHWQKLMKTAWFQEAYDRWVSELKMVLRSEAIDQIAKIARSGSPQALGAAKYLATFEWEKAGRGRPSKAELNAELKRQIAVLEVESDDAERIGLVGR